MKRLIDADALYMELVKMKDFGELTAKKAIRVVEKAPTIDAVPLDGSFLKMSKGDYLIYNRHWLYEHFDMEMDIQRSAMKSMGYEYVGKNTDAVRHGKWREYPISDGMNQCSKCGVLRFGKSNYCPNCGCRMDEE